LFARSFLGIVDPLAAQVGRFTSAIREEFGLTRWTQRQCNRD
jgi:hypothetical protein